MEFLSSNLHWILRFGKATKGMNGVKTCNVSTNNVIKIKSFTVLVDKKKKRIFFYILDLTIKISTWIQQQPLIKNNSHMFGIPMANSKATFHVWKLFNALQRVEVFVSKIFVNLLPYFENCFSLLLPKICVLRRCWPRTTMSIPILMMALECKSVVCCWLCSCLFFCCEKQKV